jgi:hypothetical protein
LLHVTGYDTLHVTQEDYIMASSAGSAQRVRKYRAELRSKGLIAKTVWVKDLNNAEYRAALQSDCQVIAASARDKEIMAELEAVADDSGWVWDGAV